MPPLAPESLSPAQRRALAEVADGPRGVAIGPFPAMVRSPELMTRMQRTGEYLRYHNALAAPLIECAVLMVARQWHQAVEWAIHEPLARAAGLEPSVIDAVGTGHRPADMSPPLRAVWQVTDEITGRRTVDDATYRLALDQLGEPAIIDLLATIGYYTTLAMIMNACRTAVPDGPVLP